MQQTNQQVKQIDKTQGGPATHHNKQRHTSPHNIQHITHIQQTTGTTYKMDHARLQLDSNNGHGCKKQNTKLTK